MAVRETIQLERKEVICDRYPDLPCPTVAFLEYGEWWCFLCGMDH
jgi:hypothetical protein